MNRKFIFAVLISIYGGSIIGQVDKAVHDSTIIMQDSVVYKSVDEASRRNTEDSVKYENIGKITERSKFGRVVHNIFFRRLQKEVIPRFSVEHIIEARNHKTGQGKIIRHINILTLDPFGHSIKDTSIHSHKVMFSIGNTIHATTNEPVIRNLLMFREKERYDSSLVKESERLVRSQQYIRDVYLVVTKVSRDSVDVGIRVLDVWSLLPSAVLTGSQTGIGLRDLNFAGTGSSLQLNTLWKKNEGNVTRLNYLKPNIRNTFISLNIQYMFSPTKDLLSIQDFNQYFYSPVSTNPKYMFSDNKNIIKSIELNRPFYSPYARWAGGAFLGQMMTTQTYLNFDTVRFLSAKTNIGDFWLGRSWQLFRDNASESVTSLVLAGRYVLMRSPRRPSEAIDADIFNNHTYYFGSLSLTSRKYYRDRYIFNYGKIEDVPAGKIAGITVGREYQQKSRLYLGLNAGTGTYYSFGYLSTHLSYGTFIDLSGFHQGMLTGRITYFTRLMTIGDWKLRQFITPSFALGIKRSPADNQSIKIGIKGFERIETLAPSITVISLQTQSYAPWNIGGFHLGPYLYTHIGILGEEPVGHKGRVYSLFGLGMLIKNDYLMFNTFQISFSFYPYIPENRYNIFRTNAYKTTDYGFRDFEVSKPGIVE